MPHNSDRDTKSSCHQHDAPGGRIPWLAFVALVLTGCTRLPEVQLAGAQGRITKGPCLLRVYQDRAALMWETDTQGQWGVSCGTEGQHDRYSASTAEEVTYSSKAAGGQSKTAYIHKVWIDGLTAGRTYAYRIVGPDLRSDVYRFHTVPAGTDEVRFIVYGDSRSQPKIHKQFVRQMIKYDVDFVIHTGDLAVRGDDYQQWDPQFFEPIKGLMERVPIYIAKGNHEGRNGNFEKLFVPPGEQNSFAFDYGPLHYFCADNVSNAKEAGGLLHRIVQDAEASKAPWKFVSYHMPSVNCGGHWSDWQQADVLPAFARAGIDFAVAGHSHQYERFRPVAPPEPTGSYVTYMTAGGGGAPLASVQRTNLHACAERAYHFCLFHIKGDTLTVEAIGVNGRILDRLEITKKDGHVDEPYASTAVSAAAIQSYQSSHKPIGTLLGLPEE
jgi:predicted phosphodiesterase